MSKIDEQIKQLREKEKQLELEKRKIEFLNHILESAQSYDHKDFKDVKSEVVAKLALFVEKAIESIENSTPLNIDTKVLTPSIPINPNKGETKVPEASQNSENKPSALGPHDLMTFAMDNRHLSGKMVSIANKENMTVKGKVVGLECPNVIVKTDTGPTIKVPLEHISLL